MITEEGFPYEKYEVTTEDNYILHVHRIPSKVENPKVVFAMHGLFASSAVFLFFGPEYSLGTYIYNKFSGVPTDRQ